MKKLLLFLSISICGIVYAQAPPWQWAKSTGGTPIGQNNISTDVNGNVFVTGNSGSYISIVKYDASGNLLWAKSALANRVLGVATDPYGNAFITGCFDQDSIIIGTTTLTNTNVGSLDFYVVKYDANGNILWVTAAGGTDNDGSQGISTDTSGNVYVTGTFHSDSINFGTTTITNVGGNWDVFTVKYNGSGNVLWAKSEGGSGGESSRAISTDVSGNVFVTGDFQSSSMTIGTDTITNSGIGGIGDNIFLLKYDASGNVLWARAAGGPHYFDQSHAVCADVNGNVFITGYFHSDSINFGTTTLTNVDTNNNNTFFVTKYDASGNVIWAKSAGVANSAGEGISTDANKNVFVAGSFADSSITFGTTILTNAGHDDMFIVKYDDSGNVIWAKSAGGTNPDLATAISVSPGGNVYVTGYSTSDSINFGTTTLFGSGIFTAKLGGTTSIEEDFINSEFKVYPNPTSGKFQLILNNSNSQASTIILYNILGEIVYKSTTTQLTNYPLTIDLTMKPKGIYLVRMQQGDKIYQSKIIVE